MNHIFIKQKDTLISILVSDIIYIRSIGDYVNIITKHDKISLINFQ